MASEYDSQRFHFPAIADERKKLDGFTLFDTGSPQDMKKPATMLEHENLEGLQAEDKYGIRRSLAWDSAFFTSPGVLEPEELFQTVNYHAMDDALDILGHEKEVLLPSQSLEPESTNIIDMCDLRKSLAWDNAFFTNSGVLDPEELSIVNQGFKKRGTSLPRIQEDVWRSTESNSTIESGTSSLSSLEIDLFEDMKASMHKYTSASDLAASSLKLLRGESNINLHSKCTSIHASKELGATSRTRMDMPISRRPSTKPHRVEKSKGSSVAVASQKKLSAGSGEINSSSSPKPPKILDRVKQIPASTKSVANVVKDGKPAPTKKASSVASVVKDGKPGSGHYLTMMRKPCPEDTIVECSSTPSPKSSSSCFPAAASSSSSHLISSRKKMYSTQANFVVNGSTLRTPVRCTMRSKSDLESSRDQTYLLSMPKSSSFTSPDSSLDGWSSESSSASVNQRANNPKVVMSHTFKPVSPESISSQHSASEKHVHNQPCIGPVGHENLDIGLPNQQSKQIQLETGSLPTSSPKNIKPSGLRLPSPKIGFFDVEDYSLQTAEGISQFFCGKQSSESRVGSGINNPNGTANQARYSKLHPSRALTWTSKQNVCQPAIHVRPTHSAQIEEVQNASVDEHAEEDTIKNCSTMTFKDENDLPCKTCYKDRLGTEKVGSKDDEAADFVIRTKAENEGTKGSARNNKGRKHVESTLYRPIKKSLNEYELPNSKFPRDYPYQIYDKENIYRFKDEVDGISRHIGAFKLGNNAV
ncbi:uncharacterized protein LOC107413673 isoform X2 [Ziziphus jujuba]|uniref:Uncharacterized protein LOC107413673 isoform X2 n=2 Tax=Ziziphus jujuba TaxID=326968 RepID=A0ABM3ICG9_ZIZJJ|nr:uncharacterized protein LOC107413673 isoform X2 [Ziziphus jujuba]KAH7537360.1 hypothetical protein FEM48_Zijuj03G0084300 [Ziziphus jujuba var. spinosa]